MTQVRFFPPLRFPYEQPPFPVYRSSITDTSPLLDFPRISLPVFFEKKSVAVSQQKKWDEWETATESTCQNVQASANRETLVNCRFISGHGGGKSWATPSLNIEWNELYNGPTTYRNKHRLRICQLSRFLVYRNFSPISLSRNRLFPREISPRIR